MLLMWTKCQLGWIIHYCDIVDHAETRRHKTTKGNMVAYTSVVVKEQSDNASMKLCTDDSSTTHQKGIRSSFPGIGILYILFCLASPLKVMM